MIRPLGKPPIPNAISRVNEPVDTASTACTVLSPRRMTVFLPNCFSIWLNAAFNALLLFSSILQPQYDVTKQYTQVDAFT